ncbi:MAG: hypothetical protein JWP48_2225 [Actinoallomurus sp.]|jgi:hypothetical protein|nr:hypothetical protein [Actinoallomurus sp.]
MRVSKVRRADAHPPAPESRPRGALRTGSVSHVQAGRCQYYFVRQRGRVSPAFLVQVSFVPVDDVPLEPAGEQN